MTTIQQDQELLEHMLRDIKQREGLLTDWETKFINNIGQRINTKAGLTEKQDECFTNIWKRVTDLRP